MNSSRSTNYEYIDEYEIDDELKCIICQQPFQYPVSLTVCNHTFCEECIDMWLYRNQTCPICRRITRNYYKYDNRSYEQCSYIPIKIQKVLNQLDCLLVRCLLCQDTNIQRSHWKDHEKQCLRRIVSCPSADIECSWKGPRDKLSIHLNHCIYQQIRPLIDKVKNELMLTHFKQIELKNKITTFERKVNIIIQLINHRNIMQSDYSKIKIKWKDENEDEYDQNHQFICNQCDRYILDEDMLINDDSQVCICRSCINN